MAPTEQMAVADLLRNQLPNLVAGIFFVLAALVAFAIASVRRRSGVTLLVWLGIWTGMFGANDLLQTPVIRESLPSSVRPLTSFWSSCSLTW